MRKTARKLTDKDQGLTSDALANKNIRILAYGVVGVTVS